MSRPRIGVFEFLKQLVVGVFEDDLTGHAARCAYALAFSLFPFLLLLLSIASFFPAGGPRGPIPPELVEILPSGVGDILVGQIEAIAATRHGTTLFVSAVVSIFSASSAMMSLVTSVNRAYDVAERRAFWKRGLLAGLLTIAGAALVFLPALWGSLGSVLSDLFGRLGLLDIARWVNWLRWPVIFAGAFAWLSLLFRVAPETATRWKLITPGALFAAVALLVANYGLDLYVTRISKLPATYGTIGGFLVLLLWLYVSVFVLLLGAEVNAIFERADRTMPPPTLRETVRSIPGFPFLRKSSRG